MIFRIKLYPRGRSSAPNPLPHISLKKKERAKLNKIKWSPLPRVPTHVQASQGEAGMKKKDVHARRRFLQKDLTGRETRNKKERE